MDSRRTRRLLIASFALSLLIHLIVASGLRGPFVRTSDEAEVVHIEHLRVTHIAHVPSPPPHTPPPHTPTPAPTATPAPVRTAAPAPARRPKASAGMPSASGTGHAAAAPATAAPTPASTPAPAPTTACANTNLPAAVAASPPPADISPQARADAVSGTTRVRVTLDAAGAVERAVVAESSGSSALDLVAVSMARAAQYTPARRDCKAVASEYVYSVKFVSW